MESLEYLRNLADYMYKEGLSPDDVLTMLKSIKDSWVCDNQFHFEIEGNTAYIEARKPNQKIKIISCNYDKGYIEVEVD